MAIYVDGMGSLGLEVNSDQLWRVVNVSVSNYRCFCPEKCSKFDQICVQPSVLINHLPQRAYQKSVDFL